jgi:hypothetical protein
LTLSTCYHLPYPTPRFLVERLHESEALYWRNFLALGLPERNHAPPGDDLEAAFVVSRPHVVAIDANYHGPVRQRLVVIVFPVLKEVRLPFFAQLLFHPLCRHLQMFPHGFVISRPANRQYFFQQVSYPCERNQRSPFCFEVEQLRTGAPGQPGRRGPECLGVAGLTRTPVPPGIWHRGWPEQRVEFACLAAFAVVALSASRAFPPPLQIFRHLPGTREVLHTTENRAGGQGLSVEGSVFDPLFSGTCV